MRVLLLTLTCLLGASTASKWPLRAKHADAVPASFDCAMRKAAYSFGQKLMPRQGHFESLYYALDLDSDCHDDLRAPASDTPHPGAVMDDDAAEPLGPIPANAYYVDPLRGDDARGGSNADFMTIQAAADAAAGAVDVDTVVLRRGTHFLTAQIQLGPKHSGLTFRSVPGDEADTVVSGGKKLSVKWKPYNVSAPGTSWVVDEGQNAVYGGTDDNKTFTVYGKTDDAPSCQKLCQANSRCKIYTWHDSYQGSYANQCWGRLDGQWAPRAEGGHTSGHLLPGVNIWVADVSGDAVDDVPGLQVDGTRVTRARYPNIPGGIETSCGYGCMVSRHNATWTPPDFNKYGKVDFYTDNITDHNRPNAGWFEHYMIGTEGLCSVYDPPVSYWCSEHPSGGGAFAFRTPSGVTPKQGFLPHAPYKNVDDAVFFVWRPARWANWMFEVGAYDAATNNFTFGKGGNQGARGSDRGGDFFIENVMEELDYPNEFFFDKESKQLFLYYNGTGAPPSTATVIAPQLRTLWNISGTQFNPVKDVKHSGITYRASRYTYMDPHGVPSAGDWALDRVGAIYLQGTEGSVFDACTFDRLDGNGVMVSGYNRNATISNSDFSFLGGNAVAAWGFTNETATDPGRPGVAIENYPQAGVDGTDGNHPVFTTVVGCTVREVGLYEKQSSFFIQAKTAASVIKGNVFFNGPRAGINANDGFGGGDEIAHNLVFSTCRESGDHGPFNSWDRQPFLTTQRTGEPSMQMQWREIHHNFFIDNYSPQEDVDNDDGSAYYHTHDNFLVYGGQGMKNDFGGHDNHHYNNIYGYVGEGLHVCSQQPGHEDYFYGNKLVMTGNNAGNFSCSGDAQTVVHDNEYYNSDGNVQECTMSLKDWQAKGQDKGSTAAKWPTDATIIGWAKEKLRF